MKNHYLNVHCARTTKNYIYVWMLHVICHEPIIKKYIKKSVLYEPKKKLDSMSIDEIQSSQCSNLRLKCWNLSGCIFSPHSVITGIFSQIQISYRKCSEKMHYFELIHFDSKIHAIFIDFICRFFFSSKKFSDSVYFFSAYLL